MSLNFVIANEKLVKAEVIPGQVNPKYNALRIFVDKQRHTIKNIPDENKLLFLAKTAGFGWHMQSTLYYVVYCPENSKCWEGLRLHLGEEHRLEQTKIVEADCLRDGGSFYIDYIFKEKKCHLFFPQTEILSGIQRIFKPKPTEEYGGRTKKLKLLYSF